MTTLHHKFEPIPLRSLDQLSAAELKRQIWQALTDFAQWPRWLAGVDEVSLSHTDAVGRGTRLRSYAFADLLISHWHIDKRIDFVSQLSYGRVAVSAVLETSKASPEPILCMRIELELLGYWRFFGPLLFWRIRRDILGHTREFLEFYQFSRDCP